MKLNSPIVKVPAKFGAFGALIILVMFFLLLITGDNPLTDMEMFDFFILPIFLFFSIKEFRDTYNNKLIEFWQGMTIGFITYTTLAIVTTLALIIFLNLANPEIFEEYVRNTIAEVTNNREQTIDKMGVDTYKRALQKVQGTTRSDLILDYLLKKLIIGLMLTIMIAVIMRRKAKEEPNTASK